MVVLLIQIMLHTLLTARPLPLIDPEFSGPMEAWVITGADDPSSCLITSTRATPETSSGTCLKLNAGQSIQSRPPILRSMKASETLHVMASASVLSEDDSMIRCELVDSDGNTRSEAVLSARPPWHRYRWALEMDQDCDLPLFLRMSHSDGSGAICLDNLAIQIVDGDGDGFDLLFNGKTLEGWQGSEAGYRVRDGVIEVLADSAGDLRTISEFSDFELRLEFLLAPGSNNGIAVRSPLEGNAAYEGIEIQVIDNFAESYSRLKPWQFHGSAYGLMPAKRGWLMPPGEWNYQSVRLHGRRLTVTLNGHVILDGDLDEALKAAGPAGASHPGALRRKGHIGFCGHGSEVRFRNIRITTFGSPLDGEDMRHID